MVRNDVSEAGEESAEVLGRDDRGHSGHRESPAPVDLADDRVGTFRTDDHTVKALAESDVDGVDGGAGDLLYRISAPDGPPCDAARMG
jgi:hypothetical protein